METLEESTQTPTQPQLIVSEDMRSYIYDTAKWANFLSIVGFVITGFLIIASFTIGAAMRTNPQLTSLLAASALSPLGFTLFCLAYAFAIFYPSLLMFKYASKARVGVLYAEQASLDEALGKMKSLFKYWGIITIIFISLYIMVIVLSIVNTAVR